MKALEHAKAVEHWVSGDAGIRGQECRAAASELRRLAEVNAELLEALGTAVSVMKIQRDIVERGQHSSAWDHPINFAESAVAKAKEQQ